MSAAGAIRAGAAYVEVFLEQNALSRSLAATSAKLRGWSAGLGRLGAATRGGELPGPLAAIANFSFSPAGLVTGMLAAVREWASGGAELARLAEKAGTTVEVISALGYAARRCGVDSGQLAMGIRRMQVAIAGAAHGMPLANKALASIGASVQDLAKLRPEEQFRYLADRIAAVPNPTLRAAAAVKLFGKSGTELLPLLNQGAAGIARFEQRARELGLVTSTGAAQAALRFSRTLADLTDVLKKCVFVIGSALGPYVEQLTDWITTAAVKVRQWINDHRGLVLVLFKVAGAIVLAGAGFSLFGRILGGIAGGIGWLLGGVRLLGSVVSVAGSLLASAWTGVTAAVSALGPLFAALVSPVGLVCVAVLALGGYVLYATGIAGDALRWLKGVFRDLAKDAMETFGAIGDALAAGDISLAAKVLWAVLKLEWQKGVNALTEIWVGVKETFMSVWTDFVYWMTGIATKAWAGLQSSWNLVTTGLTAGWTIFCDFVRSGWGATQNWLSKRWTDFMTFLGQYDAETGEQIKKNLDEDYAAEKGRRERETQSKLAGLGKGYEDREREIARDRDAVLGGLDQAKREETDRRHAAYAKQLQASQAAVDAARKEFDDARKEAADKRAAKERADREADYAGKRDFSAMDGLPGAKTSVVGTFSSTNLSGLGYGGGIFVEMKNQLSRIADTDEKLLGEVQQGAAWE